ncbi:MAG: RagB/SusD family nutrient uptake outer membrane protein [Bacteroidales bacterium]|nr:RagB/SusD family nutrient uptake outer membrane protein [Bacteroidales bacterium]
MRKSIIILCGAIFLIAQGCNVLDRNPLDSISTDEYFSTANADALESYCNSLYPSLISGHGSPNNYTYGMMETDFQSDDLLPWTYNEVAFSQHTISTSDSNWDWTNIRTCNLFLENYDKSPESDEVKHRYAGEILFFRCLDNFNKVRRFGDIPWYDHSVNPGDEDLYRARDSRTVVMANVLDDINQAIEWLPTKSTTGVYRISKDAALALKARMCLFEGTYRRYHGIEDPETFLQAAYDAAGELMDPSYGYSLYTGTSPQTAYQELFIQADYNNNSEVIMSKEYDPSVGYGSNLTRMIGLGESPIGFSRDAIEDYLCITGKPISQCGCEGHTTHTTLVAELNNRDPRLLQTTATPEDGMYTYYLDGQRPDIGMLTGVGARVATGYAVAKWFDEANYSTDHNTGTQDAPIFRYGEILLVRAEAGAELGKDPELDKTVNALRARVGFTVQLTETPDEDPKLVEEYPTILGNGNANLIREIRRERRVEMIAEGQRYYDLMRWACGLRLNEPKLGIILDRGDAVTEYSDEDYATIMAGNVDIDSATGAINIYSSRMTNPTANFIEPKNYLFSVPTDEISLNPNLTQNPGW